MIVNWNVTPAEIAAPYPSDAFAPRAAVRLLRGVDVAAPPDVVFRWVCQIRAAPYSYDWIDNLGRQSPRELTPGADALERGQRFAVIFRIVAFEPGVSITATAGSTALSYVVVPAGAGCRLLGVMSVRRLLLPIAPGDLVMMRKQLLTLKALAEGRHP